MTWDSRIVIPLVPLYCPYEGRCPGDLDLLVASRVLLLYPPPLVSVLGRHQ
jgi:hypothetical protein